MFLFLESVYFIIFLKFIKSVKRLHFFFSLSPAHLLLRLSGLDLLFLYNPLILPLLSIKYYNIFLVIKQFFLKKTISMIKKISAEVND